MCVCFHITITLYYISEKKSWNGIKKIFVCQRISMQIYSYSNMGRGETFPEIDVATDCLWFIVELYILKCIPVIHGETRRRHHWRKLSTGDQLDKLNQLLWPPPANLICIFSLSTTADEYCVAICLCWFVGNKISVCLSVRTPVDFLWVARRFFFKQGWCMWGEMDACGLQPKCTPSQIG